MHHHYVDLPSGSTINSVVKDVSTTISILSVNEENFKHFTYYNASIRRAGWQNNIWADDLEILVETF